MTGSDKKYKVFEKYLLTNKIVYSIISKYLLNRKRLKTLCYLTYARVAQWWSVSLPRRRSRVRSPSRAFSFLENPVVDSLFHLIGNWQSIFVSNRIKRKAEKLMSGKTVKRTEKSMKKNSQPKDVFLENQSMIMTAGILLFTAGVGVNIARVAWGAATWKSFLWNVAFLAAYMIVFEGIKIYRLYHIKQSEYEEEKRKAKKKGNVLPEKNRLDFLFEAANHKNR